MLFSRFKRKEDTILRNMDSSVFFVEFCWNALCLSASEHKIIILKEYNVKHHYVTKHGEPYEKNKGNERKEVMSSYKDDYYPSKNFYTMLARTLMLQLKQVMWLVNKLAKWERQFLKDCMLAVADILCPEKKSLFNSVN